MKQTLTKDEIDSTSIIAQSDKDIITVKAPRALWLDALLGFLTFGLYYCFWLVGRVKEVKRLRQNTFTPWLWFFVPLVPLAVLFAYPRLFREMKQLEEEIETSKSFNWKKLESTWILAVFVIPLFDRIVTTLGLSLWMYFIALVMIVGLYALLQQRFQTMLQVQQARIIYRKM